MIDNPDGPPESPAGTQMGGWARLVRSPDIDGNGRVGRTDLEALKAAWGACRGCPTDLDGDGWVGASDLMSLLGSWASGSGL